MAVSGVARFHRRRGRVTLMQPGSAGFPGAVGDGDRRPSSRTVLAAIPGK